ncbi:hypothetical protein Moror_14045 [Moniliophthora roreri MCA 2997]|uniref:Nicotinamide n-methyltransferase n=2 Tax=Moniliophthora roreri TaxID=221103 RepID=V2X6T4_MONRO|nr:hypothetical protein Moror_14045 [Moniliophthora roreri MCA 2997]
MNLAQEFDSDHESDPEEILNSSLQTLYDYQPITLSSSGSLFTYTSHSTKDRHEPITISVQTPDTLPSNWSLYASSIWKSSQYMADHLDDLDLRDRSVRLLELGAGAGLPGIFIAKTHPQISVTISDYPDEKLIQTLSGNINRNKVEENCCLRAYAWGSDINALLQGGDDPLFDVIIAADTLWNPDFHAPLVESLKMLLKRSDEARVHLVAGLHTGRYTLYSFLQAIQRAGFVIDSAEEREVKGSARRTWDISRAEDEDEKDRRRWVLWVKLRWPKAGETELV